MLILWTVKIDLTWWKLVGRQQCWLSRQAMTLTMIYYPCMPLWYRRDMSNRQYSPELWMLSKKHLPCDPHWRISWEWSTAGVIPLSVHCPVWCFWGRLIFALCLCQQTRSTPESAQEELNDLKPPIVATNRASRSSLNAITQPSHRANNTVTTAIVTLPTSSNNSETEALCTPETHTSPSGQSPHMSSAVRISAL